MNGPSVQLAVENGGVITVGGRGRSGMRVGTAAPGGGWRWH